MTISSRTNENVENKRPELLAPAGDYECFIAAMNAGADAVYLGLSDYGARAFAKNFSQDDLINALDIAHILGRRIYLTVNTLLKDEEISKLYDMLEKPYINGLHGVIVQDIGVMSFIHRTFPELEIHVSTQAAITSSKGCEIFKDLGVTRIVPARELSLDEIKKLKIESGLEVECFVHGSMCYSYSGKCLLSSFIGGRSGNRGRCAGPCRLMYDDSYPLSLKDMCTIDLIPELTDAGIDSFKIEGRMKSREYVYGVTSLYRKYVDLYCGKHISAVDPDDRNRLISYYTRSGNCTGYYHAHNGTDMITIDCPSYESSTKSDSKKDISKIPAIPVKLTCEIKNGKSVKISAVATEAQVSLTSDVVPDKATGGGLTKDDVKEQLIKSGGTNFRVEDISLDLDESLFIPKSKLNAIRREILDELKDEIVSSYRRKPVKENISENKIKADNSRKSARPDVNASVLTLSQLREVCRNRTDGVVIPLDLIDDPGFVAFSDMADAFENKKVYISLPFVIREEEKANSSKRITDTIARFSQKHDIEGFYISNNESLEILKEAGYSNNITGDIHIYAYNREAYDIYISQGLLKTTVPVELNSKELYERGIKGEELLVYGRIPVMISASCIYNTKSGCRPLEKGHKLYIKDRKNARLFVNCICTQCMNVIYNSEVLSISDEETLFDRIRPSSVRFAFTDEPEATVKAVLDKYFAERNDNGSTGVKLLDRYTKGHLNRGVD